MMLVQPKITNVIHVRIIQNNFVLYFIFCYLLYFQMTHPRFQVNQVSGILKIIDVHLKDEGNYACVVNTTGHPIQTSTNAHLYVKSKQLFFGSRKGNIFHSVFNTKTKLFQLDYIPYIILKCVFNHWLFNISSENVSSNTYSLIFHSKMCLQPLTSNVSSENMSSTPQCLMSQLKMFLQPLTV